MSSQTLINEFQANNAVVLDTARIKTSLTSILSKIEDNKAREERIGDFIKHEYSKIAEVFEFNKARATLMNQSDVTTTSSLEFFEEYVNIISEIVKETSQSLLEKSEEDRKKAEEAVQAAKKENEKAQNKFEDAQKMDMNKETGREIDRDFVLNKFKDDVQNTTIALNNAEKKLKDVAPFKPYESSMDYFGISEKEAKHLLEKQVNSATYMNVRRSQMDAVGVTSPVFMKDLTEAFAENAAYKDASAGNKRRMQQVYATKQIMKETLDSKKGFWGWVWKAITHRTEAKAMRNYIKAAEQALTGAGFDETAEKEATAAMAQRGYLYGRYKNSGAETDIKEKFAENEKKYAEYKAKFERVSTLPIRDQFFEINFRPARDSDTFHEQRLAFNDVRKIVEKGHTNKTLPKEVYEVFKLTSKKLKAMKDSRLTSSDLEFDVLEKSLMDKGMHENYNAMKFTEVQNLVEQKENIVVDFDNNEKNITFSEAVENAPQLTKDPLAKNN